jgi:hypothetical protein
VANPQDSLMDSYKAKMVSCLAVLLIAGTIILLAAPNIPYIAGDAHQYIRIAEKGPTDVPRPHATRIVLPYLVKLLNPILPTHQAFFFIAICSLLCLIICVKHLLSICNTPLSIIILIMINPLLVYYFRQYYIPDLFYMAILSIYLVLIFYDKQLMGSAVLFILFMTRETTIFLSITVLVISLLYNRRNQLIFTIVAMALGLSGFLLLGKISGSNIWGLSERLYILFKIPYATLRNLAGINLVTNVVTFCDPVWKINLPQSIQLGGIKTVGICRWDPEQILSTISLSLIAFGIGPTILLAYFKNFRSSLADKDDWLKIAFFYGIFIFLVSYFISIDKARVIGYGWPLFWLAIPILLTLDKSYEISLILKPLIIIHVIVTWIGAVIIQSNEIFSIHNNIMVLELLAITLCLTMHLAAWKMLHKGRVPSPGGN